jgi:hypothetical protein
MFFPATRFSAKSGFYPYHFPAGKTSGHDGDLLAFSFGRVIL